MVNPASVQHAQGTLAGLRQGLSFDQAHCPTEADTRQDFYLSGYTDCLIQKKKKMHETMAQLLVPGHKGHVLQNNCMPVALFLFNCIF